MINNFIQWGLDRDLYNNSTRQLQILKYLEEKGELAKAVGKNDKELVMDAIGDMIVCLTHVAYYDGEIDVLKSFLEYGPIPELDNFSCAYRIDRYTDDLFGGWWEDFQHVFTYMSTIAKSYNLTLKDCMEFTWNIIKNRDGKYINGLFVKEPV